MGRTRIVKLEQSPERAALTQGHPKPCHWPGGDSSGQSTLEFPMFSWKKTPLPSPRGELGNLQVHSVADITSQSSFQFSQLPCETRALHTAPGAGNPHLY